MFDIVLPVQIQKAEGLIAEFANRVGFIGGDDVIIRGILLDHLPHGFHVISRKSPVTPGLQIAQVEAVLESHFDAGGGTGDFAGYKGFTAPGRFVIEHNAVAGMQLVGLAVIHG